MSRNSPFAGHLALPGLRSVVMSLALVVSMSAGCDDGTQLDGELVLVDKVVRDLKVTSIRPDEGLLAGGTLVILTGEGFETDMTVSFGDNAAGQVYVGGDELAALYTPAGTAPGAVTVAVTRKSDGAAATVAEGFTYLRDDVLVSEVIPHSGPLEGNTLATIVGKGFTDGAKVFFGAEQALSARVVGSDAIAVVVPPGAAVGPVSVRIELLSGATSTLESGYTYTPETAGSKLEVLGVIPSTGPLAGGNTITIEGKGFIDGATVKVGNQAATDVRVLGPNAISAVAPAGLGAGLVEVRVELPEEATVSTRVAFLEDAYRYLPDAPNDLSVLATIPAEGPLAGGNIVAVQGTGFVDGTKVYFNGVLGTQVQVLGPNALTTRVPAAEVSGPVEVRIELPPQGEVAGAAASLASGYTYEPGDPALLVLRPIPQSGPQSGGNVVALEGTGFRPGAAVYFGGAPASDVIVLGPTALTCVAPAGAMPQAVNLRVELPALAGQTAGDAYTLPAAYTYELGGVVSSDLNVASLFPTQDDEAGGALVFITGTGFTPAMVVRFGASQSPLVQVLSSNAATALVPPGTAGLVDVTVLNPDNASVSLANGFRYVPESLVDSGLPPALGAVTPARGPLAGGTLVRIAGSNFADNLSVRFGDTAATSVRVISPTLATAITPAGMAGAVAVTVSQNEREDSLANAFVYANPETSPTVVSTWPATGPSSGGTWVTITGTAFSAESLVWFGMSPAATTFIDSTQLLAVAPASAVGSVDLTVVRADGAWARSANAFAYFDVNTLPADPPVVAAAFPRVGNTAGGDEVSVSGSGFAANARVYFGTAQAQITSSPASTQRIVRTPPGLAGSVAVTVVNPDGLTSSKAGAFVYTTPPPLIQSVEPGAVAASGGAEIVITGKNFAPNSTVRLGTMAISNFNVATATRLTFFAPAHAPAVLQVSVTNPDGQNDRVENGLAYLSDDQFASPSVSGIEPNLGLATGGYFAVIRGENFQPGATVAFGTTPATNVQVVTDNVINAVVPAGTAGQTTSITVANAADKRGTLANAFTWTAAPVGPISIRSVAPGLGPIDGGSVITISGDGFEAGSAVLIGGVPSPAVSVISPSVITAVTPAGEAGLVDVRVQRPDLTAATAFKAFAYYDPATLGNGPSVFTVDPVLGPVTGGTAVMITGQRFASPVQVFFGADAAATVTVLDANRIVARTPPAATTRSVAVSVINFDGLVGVLPGGFSYYDASGGQAPAVYTVLPFTGSVFGGDEVTIVGENLTPGTRVYICDRPAVVTGLTTSQQLHVTTPAGDVGPCRVTVVNPDGLTGNRIDAFTYASPSPTVTEVIPRIGPIAGGIDVVVRGNNFVPGASVRFGNSVSPRVVVADQVTLTATLPPSTLGLVDVTVVNPGGAQGTREDAFEYVTSTSGIPPTLLTVAPASGPLGGGTPVQLLGQNFHPDVLVLFNQQALTNRVFVSTSEIRIVTPPSGTSGTVPITVLNPDGLGATLPAGFTFTNPTEPAPEITSVVPSTGREAGGTQVTITGNRFSANGTWTLGGKPLTNVATISGSLVTARTPANLPGRYDLIYVGPDGQVALKLQAFEYLAAPTLASVTPALGGVGGGTEVTLIGGSFKSGMEVYFNNRIGQVLAVQSENTALARAPSALAAGFADVRVRNTDGQESTLDDGYEYLDAPDATGVWPPTGPDPGNTLVTITGTGFHRLSRVFFGAEESSQVVFHNNTTLLVFSPAGPPGRVGVRVLNPDGREDTLANAFNYVDAASLGAAPFVGEIFPARGPTTGGTRVSLDGANIHTQARVFFLPAPATIDMNLGNRIIAIAPARATVGPSQVWLVNPDGQTIRALEDFTYLDPAALGTPPLIGSVDPTTGPTSGATEVTLIGQHFQPNARVRFGGRDSATVSNSSQQTRVLTTSHPAGSASVWLVNPDGTQALAPATFRFLPPPDIIGVNPNRSPASGGVAVTISGRDFKTDPAGALPDVFFCSDYALGLECELADPGLMTVNTGGTEISVIIPPHVPALTDVVVTAPDGQVDVLARAFTYSALPTLQNVTPTSGPSAGGTTIAITGANFQQGATVRLGGAICTNLVVVDANNVTCRTPSGTNGAATLVLTNADGGSTSLALAFTYVPAPQVSNMVPRVGPETGGVVATITGSHFFVGQTKPTVRVGATVIDPAQVTVNGTTSIAIVIPPGSGSNDVRVTNPDGQFGTLFDGFTYIPPLLPPSITFVTPTSGTTLGGDAVRIAGSNFLDGARVYFGVDPDWYEADDVQVANNGTLLRLITPAAPEGMTDVRVVNSDGQEATLANAFEFRPPATEAPLAFLSIEPRRSIIQGGGTVTISGKGFRQGIQVRFIPAQGAAALSPEVNRLGPTLLQVRVPASPTGAAGQVTVRLVNPPAGGQPEVIDAANAFEYVNGPVFVRHPGDRLPNEPQNDRGSLIFDANGDGLNDVLVFTDSINRLLLNGFEGRAAHFQQRDFAPNSGGFATVSAVAKDFNGDGRLDILRQSGDTIQYCPNLGGGEFASCTHVASYGCGLRELVVEDFNCDGVDDIFLPFSSTSTNCFKRILIGRGDGGFLEAPQGTIPGLLERTMGVAAADVDNDNDIDLLLANDDNIQNRLYLNNCSNLQDQGVCTQGIPHFDNASFGDRTYAFSRSPTGSPQGGHMTTGTWDQARDYCRAWDMDLVRIDTAEEDAFVRARNQQYVWMGLKDFDGTNTFSWVEPGGAFTKWCPSEPNTPSYDCGIYQYSGTESQRCWIDYPCNNGSYFVCESPLPRCTTTWQFVDAQYGPLDQGKNFPVSGGNSRDALLVDINDDDLPDAIIANWGQSPFVYINVGGRFADDDLFRWPQFESNKFIERLLASDIDGDTDIDVIVQAQNWDMRIYANDYVQPGGGGIGAFVNETSVRWPNGDGLDSRTDVTGFDLGDLDGDNLPDIYLVGRTYTDRLVMNRGFEEGLPWIDQSRVPAGNFRFNTFRALPDRFYAGRGAVHGDLDGDQAPDIVKCGWQERLEVFYNDGAGKFVEVSEEVLPTDYWFWCESGRQIKLVDIDEDNDLDIVYEGSYYHTTCSGNPSGFDCRGRLQLINDGAGNFVNVANTNVPHSLQTGTTSVDFTDLDQDGDLDWLVGVTWPSNVSQVFINGGNVWNVGGVYGFLGTQWFVDPTQNNSPTLDTSYTWDLAFFDLNGDIFPDVFLGRHGQNKVLRNVSGRHFTDVTQQWANVTSDTTYRLLPADYDKDGDDDFMIINSGTNRYLYRQATSFADITASAFTAQVSGDSRGADSGDVDLDPNGYTDFVVATYNQQNRMYINLGGTSFLDLTANLPWDQMRSYDAFLFDVDDDGDLDIYWVNQDQDRIYINTIIP